MKNKKIIIIAILILLVLVLFFVIFKKKSQPVPKVEPKYFAKTSIFFEPEKVVIEKGKTVEVKIKADTKGSQISAYTIAFCYGNKLKADIKDVVLPSEMMQIGEQSFKDGCFKGTVYILASSDKLPGRTGITDLMSINFVGQENGETSFAIDPKLSEIVGPNPDPSMKTRSLEIVN